MHSLNAFIIIYLFKVPEFNKIANKYSEITDSSSALTGSMAESVKSFQELMEKWNIEWKSLGPVAINIPDFNLPNVPGPAEPVAGSDEPDKPEE